MDQNILIILGHPSRSSFCNALADAYQQGAESTTDTVRRINLSELAFDPILHEGYSVIQELEPDLVKVQESITWASHLVWIYPTWWSGPPALLKGLIDRVFLPGFAFHYRENSALWTRLLTGFFR